MIAWSVQTTQLAAANPDDPKEIILPQKNIID